MEEDVQIDFLLKASEEMMIGAAVDRTSVESSQQNVLESEYFQQSFTVSPENNNLISDYNDEVQELIDHHIVSYVAKEPKKHLVQLHSLSTDDSEESCDENNSDDEFNFLNDINLHNKEYSEGILEQQNKSSKNTQKKNTASITRELSYALQLIEKRGVLLRNLEKVLKEKQLKIHKATEDIRDKISLSSGLVRCAKLSSPNPSRNFFKSFGAPYIKTVDGFRPSLNQDHLLKLQTDQTELVYVEKPSYWTKDHRQKILEAIKKTLVEEKTVKLNSQLNKLKTIIKKSPLSKTNVSLKTQFSECKEKLCSLGNKSLGKLISEENPDRKYDWMKYSISLFDGNHSADECQRYWEVYLKPSINKSKWTDEEDSKLLSIAEEMQYQDWDTIARKLLTNRSAYQCFAHFQTRLNTSHNYTKGKWTKEEDEKLLNAIDRTKIGNFIPWTKVANHVSERNPTQVYNRFKKCLDPNLAKGRFTRAEDILVVAGVEVFGCNYKELSSLLTNRIPSQIRERYETYLLPKTRRIGSWTINEDTKLMKLVDKYGLGNWSAVSKEMKTRTRTQIRHRYRIIKRQLASKPSLTISQLNRRDVHVIDKRLKRTEQYVQKIKEEIEQVEKAFNLTKIEKDTFRIEKLKELRDKVLSNASHLKKPKVKVTTVRSTETTNLLEFFKHDQIDTAMCSKIESITNCEDYLQQVVFLAKNCGHELQLPEDESEILSNPRLSSDIKTILLQNSCGNSLSTTFPCSMDATITPEINTFESSIDYVPPVTDTTLMVNQWCFSPPIDIKRLNFSELFKQTVFDYSWGMHKDIWNSKIKRSLQPDHFYICESTLPDVEDKQYCLPPSQLTALGLKSVLLSKSRLKNDSIKEENVEELKGNKMPRSPEVNVLLDQFQDTLSILFTWPRVLSFTSVTSIPIIKNSLKKPCVNQITNLGKKSIISYQSIQQNTTTSPKKKQSEVKRKKSNFEQHLRHVRQARQIKKGAKSVRKMKIEDLLPHRKQDFNKCLPLATDVNKYVRKKNSIVANNNKKVIKIIRDPMPNIYTTKSRQHSVTEKNGNENTNSVEHCLEDVNICVGRMKANSTANNNKRDDNVDSSPDKGSKEMGMSNLFGSSKSSKQSVIEKSGIEDTNSVEHCLELPEL